ncbi:MAG: hypothetical protein QM692_11220 [Thermomicrobiales bacterium]
MNATLSSIPRRRMLAAGLGAAALALPLAQPRAALARTILQRGMAGGGLAQLDGDGEPRLANFGLFASAVQLPEGENLVLGSIQWIEAGTDLQIRSSTVIQCIPIPNRTDGAEVRGRMTVNGEGDYPFVMRAMDGGAPGSALDRVELEVNTGGALGDGIDPGSDDEFTYTAGGNVVAGDVQWVVADINI